MTPARAETTSKPMLSQRVYGLIRNDIMRGAVGPGASLRPQELATSHGVSLAVVREALVRLVGDGLVDRLPNRGFAVPAYTDRRWRELGETRLVLEPAMLRMAIERGDVAWESRVRAEHHRLLRTPAFEAGDDTHYSESWATAHHAFHRALLEGCGNEVLLDTFDRLWIAIELGRRWAGRHGPLRDHVAEHRALEEAVLARDADLAVVILVDHLSQTAAALAPDA
jgi:DNA-binding GntR family transcriptional regulator